jgi:hypothetical protein
MTLFFALPMVPACSSSTDAASDDAGSDGVVLEDIRPFEEPEFESNDPAGRVRLVIPYHPDTRCIEPPTQLGHFDKLDDGGIAPCGTHEMCYVRKDGVAMYDSQDCVHGLNFVVNVDELPYSDLGPCEPFKHFQDKLLSCPTSTCIFARDVRIDTARGCATAITTKDCRDTVGAPKGCFCDPASSDVFVTFDGKTSSAVPAGFTPCDSTSTACKNALAIVDTVNGCAATTDAGTD